MGRSGFLVALVSAFALLASAAPAGAATPSLQAQFAPVNAQIKKIGVDIGTALNGASKSTDLQLAKSMTGLAQRAAASSAKVGKLKGATGATLVTVRQLQLDLAKGAIDLARIATALTTHNAVNARAATKSLDQGLAADHGGTHEAREIARHLRLGEPFSRDQWSSERRRPATARCQRAVASVAAVRSGMPFRSSSSSGGP